MPVILALSMTAPLRWLSTQVTFVPDTQGDSIAYVPRKGEKTPYEFIDKYEEAYLDLFNEYAR